MSKLFQVIFTIFTLFVSMSQGAVNYSNVKLINKFSMWMNKFNIETRNEDHLAHIFDNWISNNKYIEEMNGKNLSYTLGHNAFSGMDSGEFGQYMGFEYNKDVSFKGLRGSVNSVHPVDTTVYDVSSLPSSVDWRTKGAVTSVKNQGQCGSCWSFSTTGALEGVYEINNGKLVSFSEQQLVDCDYGLRLDHACNGGLMNSAFSWISQNGGLCTETDYPYVSGTTQTNGECKKTCNKVAGSTIVSYSDVTPNSDSAMMTALSQQPVSVAIEADQRAFQLYSGGVFSEVCGTNLDHGVLLVGYGTDSASGLDYYILKNSWGESWGTQNGFMLLGRNVDASGKTYNNGAGQCGVLMEASYPTL